MLEFFCTTAQMVIETLFRVITTPEIVVILASPAVAVAVGELLRKRNFEKEKRLEVLYDLVAYRDKLESIEFLRALNSLKLFFKDKELKDLLYGLRESFRKINKREAQPKEANQLIIKIIRRVCALEGFKRINEEDIEHLFKKR